MSKKVLLLIFISVFFTFPSFAEDKGHSSKVITFNMTYYGYPPFMICNKDEKTSCGIMYEVFTNIMGKLGYSVRTAHVPKKREIEFFTAGKIDAHPMAKEWVENPEDYVFSDPVLKARNLIFSNAKQPVKYSNINDLLGKRAITNLGFVYPPLTKLFEKGAIKRIDAIGEKAMMQMLIYQRGDFAIVNEHVGKWLIKENNWQSKFSISEKNITDYDFRIMFAKKFEEIIPLFNHELQIMKDNGDIEEIISRYIN